MIVVTGATGNVGRPLVRALAGAGERVTTVSRGPWTPPDGVRHLRADLAEPEGLKPALDGAEALFLLFTGALLADPAHAGAVLAAARSAGVRRVVLMSSQGVGTHRHPPAFEDEVLRSGLEWTMLRPGGFHSNTLLWADAVRARREVAAPFGDVALPTIDPADIADVAALTLRTPGHTGRTYTLTGPAPVSPREQTAAIAAALGEPVRFTEQTPQEARADLLTFMPPPVADATLSILGSPTAEEQRVDPTAERLLGRRPRAFAEWAARNADAFR
ncbi:NAD(P)H-binding protein [Streptomyces capparidis]